MPITNTTISTFVAPRSTPFVRDVPKYQSVTLSVAGSGHADAVTLHFRTPDDLRAWLAAATASLDEIHPVAKPDVACVSTPMRAAS